MATSFTLDERLGPDPDVSRIPAYIMLPYEVDVVAQGARNASTPGVKVRSASQ